MSLLRIGVRRIRTITEVHFALVKALITRTIESGKESYFYMPYLIAAIKILAQYVIAVKSIIVRNTCVCRIDVRAFHLLRAFFVGVVDFVLYRKIT